MSYLIEEIELLTNDELCRLIFREVEKFTDGSGYTCKLTVRSGSFACIDRQFFFDDSHFPEAMRLLRQMEEGKVAKAVIKGQWETDFICFESNDMGHVFVTGEIEEHSDLPQTLKFSFQTDQTVLGPLIRGFSQLLDS